MGEDITSSDFWEKSIRNSINLNALRGSTAIAEAAAGLIDFGYANLGRSPNPETMKIADSP